MRPVAFKWNQSKRADVGFIAEEVEEFDPRLVAHVTTTNENGEEISEPASVYYEKITAFLVKTVADLRDEVKALKDEINNLKK
jgi:UDP-N-acetylmuramyl tripeptide synthase